MVGLTPITSLPWQVKVLVILYGQAQFTRFSILTYTCVCMCACVVFISYISPEQYQSPLNTIQYNNYVISILPFLHVYSILVLNPGFGFYLMLMVRFMTLLNICDVTLHI